MHTVRATVNALRVLSVSIGARADLKKITQEARALVLGLERLADDQRFPRGEEIVAKSQLTKSPLHSCQTSVRKKQLRDLFETEILPVFVAQDSAGKGQGRFHLLLTHVEA